MRRLSPLVLSLLSLTACREPQRPAPTRPTPARPAADVATSAQPAPAPDVVAAPEPSPASDASAPEERGVRVFRVGESACVRDPARERLTGSVHGYFTQDRIELEVRNVRHGCAPGPTYTAALEGNTLRVRYAPASREALARCACRHDQFLQVVGVPRGAYDVVVEPLTGGDAGPPVATGRVDRGSER